MLEADKRTLNFTRSDNLSHIHFFLKMIQVLPNLGQQISSQFLLCRSWNAGIDVELQDSVTLLHNTQNPWLNYILFSNYCERRKHWGSFTQINPYSHTHTVLTRENNLINKSKKITLLPEKTKVQNDTQAVPLIRKACIKIAKVVCLRDTKNVTFASCSFVYAVSAMFFCSHTYITIYKRHTKITTTTLRKLPIQTVACFTDVHC